MKSTQHNITLDEKSPLLISLLGGEETDEFAAGAPATSIVQFFVFQGGSYLGWDCFHKERISLGKSDDADLVLHDQSIADLHAVIHWKGDHLIVSDESLGQGGGVKVNGRQVAARILGPLDFVTIGPYTLKIKVKGMANKMQDIEALRLDSADSLHADFPLVDSPYADPPQTATSRRKEYKDRQDDRQEEITPFEHAFSEPEQACSEPEQACSEPEQACSEPEQALHFPSGEGETRQTAPQAQETTSQTQKATPQAQETMPQAQEALSLYQDDNQDDTPWAQDTLMQHLAGEGQGILPWWIEDDESQAQEKSPKDRGALCQTQEKSPQAQGPLRQPQEILPWWAEDKEPQAREKVSQPRGESPQAEEMVLQTKDALLQIQEVLPKVQEALTLIDAKYDDEDDEDEDDDEESVASFSLREKLIHPGPRGPLKTQQANLNHYTSAAAGRSEDGRDDVLLEVIKLREGEVIDVRFLNQGEKYFCSGEHGRFCLAEHKSAESFPFFFTDGFQGKLIHDSISESTPGLSASTSNTSESTSGISESASNTCTSTSGLSGSTLCTAGSISEDITRLCLPENYCYSSQGNNIYRSWLAFQETLYLKDGDYEYIMRTIRPSESPQVSITRKEGRDFYRNLLKSLLIHVLVLLFGGLFSLPDQPHMPVPLESRFAEIDTRQLAEVGKKAEPEKVLPKEPKKAKPLKVAAAEVVKPEPAKVQEKKVQEKKARKSAPSRANRTDANRTKRQATARSAADAGTKSGLSPNAGGGSGKDGGNILNRNIKQAGLLGVLGTKNGTDTGAKEVLASVTNLDIVASPKSGAGNFKVGGIVGKLTTSRIEVSSGGVVTTKGSTQVLRSAGVAGKGNVAAYGKGEGTGLEAGEQNRVGALEVGQTGQRQVMGMVKAELSKKVLVQGGGMSREAVKKVIDRHIDEITNCYEAALISNPSLMGKIIFEWKILLSGRVGEVRISFSSVRSDSIHECIKEKIKSWQFPEPQGAEVIVSYPFIFDIAGF
ncbi:MAG: AgmX/PglI C-terminal domain-containing protein [bacterium]